MSPEQKEKAAQDFISALSEGQKTLRKNAYDARNELDSKAQTFASQHSGRWTILKKLLPGLKQTHPQIAEQVEALNLAYERNVGYITENIGKTSWQLLGEGFADKNLYELLLLEKRLHQSVDGDDLEEVGSRFCSRTKINYNGKEVAAQELINSMAAEIKDLYLSKSPWRQSYRKDKAIHEIRFKHLHPIFEYCAQNSTPQEVLRGVLYVANKQCIDAMSREEHSGFLANALAGLLVPVVDGIAQDAPRMILSDGPEGTLEERMNSLADLYTGGANASWLVGTDESPGGALLWKTAVTGLEAYLLLHGADNGSSGGSSFRGIGGGDSITDGLKKTGGQ